VFLRQPESAKAERVLARVASAQFARAFSMLRRLNFPAGISYSSAAPRRFSIPSGNAALCRHRVPA
jgi:hypothetical protein